MGARLRTGIIVLLTGTRPICLLTLLAALLVAGPVFSAGLEVRVSGVDGLVSENVRNFVFEPWFNEATLSSNHRRRIFTEGAQQRAVQALRPFGYYAASARGTLEPGSEDGWVLNLVIDPGPSMRVESARVEVQGEGADLPGLVEWREAWPLPTGALLDQTAWEQQKQAAVDLAASEGYLLARFSTQRIELDLDRQQARLVLVLETGPRARMGKVDFRQALVYPEVLAATARFEPGDPYRAFLVEQFRLDLWRTGYFSEVEVSEVRRLDDTPPTVDFEVEVEARHRDTHQTTLGYGTDTEFRMQYRWDRHLLSPRGDSFNAGAGWKKQDEQLRLFGEYRLPRRTDSLQYWAVSSLLQKEIEDLRITDNEGDLISLAKGRVDNGSGRFSRVRLRPVFNSRERVSESLYIEHLNERNELGERELGDARPPDQGSVNDLLQRTSRSLSIGIDYDWPVISGRGFSTVGHHERAWLFSANEAWGSELDFTQLYLSSNWNVLLGERLKLLARAEIGYSDAELVDVSVELEGQSYLFSVTELPHRYRFFAGGSQSVRGYGYEELSTNGIGSNHLLTASVELEYNIHGDWSGALFFDAGNAFNDWDERDIRMGTGLGVRWYTVAGALRLDAGQALDKPGKPWEFYITIGTPLL